MSEPIPTTEMPGEAEPLSGTYHTAHDPGDGPSSEAVYRAVGEALGVDPGTRPIPVAESIDPDGLDVVLRDADEGVYVSFTVWDHRVVVHGDGHIFVHPPDEDHVV